jgi:membrane associated rhomboid family serine protease
MSSSDPSIPAIDPLSPADLVEAGAYRTEAEAFQHSLVVLAMEEPCWLVPFGEADDGGYRLLVEPAALDAVREQLACFDRESIAWPPRPAPDPLPARKAEFVTPLLWALLVGGVFWAQGRWPGWSEAGAVDARAIFDRGEAWRLVTALFLHADADHLVSNELGGILVFSAVISTFGRARGWLGIGLAAVLGNFAVAAAHYPGEYRSLGASTAIFAGLGLLTGRAIRVVMGAAHPRPVRAVFVPLAAGLTVLGLYGAGGVRIDVLAHIAGFVAGLLLGFSIQPARTVALKIDRRR